MLAARKNHKSPSKSEGRALALIPVAVAVLFAGIALPRAVVPADTPLPTVDIAKVDALLAADAARARQAGAAPLPSSVRAVGSAIRAFFAAEANREPDERTAELHERIIQALRYEETTDGVAGLVTLRAVDVEEFAVRLAEASAKGVARTPELDELAGPIVNRLSDAGLGDGTHVHLSETEAKVLYREVFAATLGLQHLPELAPTLDEERLRYAMLLGRGRPGPLERRELAEVPTLALLTTGAETAAQKCERESTREQQTLAAWRMTKVRELGDLDPTYPTLYAVGVLAYQHGDYDISVSATRNWLETHPRGEWSLRAENLLRAGLAATVKQI